MKGIPAALLLTLVARVALAAPVEPAAPDPPSLVVFSDPPGASVYLDDERLGRTSSPPAR